jgi:hypothetical protein
VSEKVIGGTSKESNVEEAIENAFDREINVGEDNLAFVDSLLMSEIGSVNMSPPTPADKPLQNNRNIA